MSFNLGGLGLITYQYPIHSYNMKLKSWAWQKWVEEHGGHFKIDFSLLLTSSPDIYMKTALVSAMSAWRQKYLCVSLCINLITPPPAPPTDT